MSFTKRTQRTVASLLECTSSIPPWQHGMGSLILPLDLIRILLQGSWNIEIGSWILCQCCFSAVLSIFNVAK